jgi:hypothetical protein
MKLNLKAKGSNPVEGYIFTSYGGEKYLKDAIIAATTVRRYDKKRKIALFCTEQHREKLKEWNIADLIERVEILEEPHRSIIGFKHNLHRYMPYDRNMYLDSDIIWCRDPDPLWHQFALYGYTITGQESADVFFGTRKHAGIVSDIFFRRRQRTLKRFGLTHLYRVQTGIMYAADRELTKEVDTLAASYNDRMDETHFISRTYEKGRKLESCEWSLGLAMSEMKLFVYPWFNGYESPQLDYIHGMTRHNKNFTEVECLYYCNPFIHSLRGIKHEKVRESLIGMFSLLPRSRDHIWVTPYVLHFGWKHQKKYYREFTEYTWNQIYANSEPVNN